ncbi:MAG TPA: ATPase, T2SS/T4P/T4SS family, partial [Kofleriaceae bacterium]
MSSQLEQILAYLDRDGVSEVVIAVGRPIAMRQKGQYVNLTQRPLTTAMLWAFVEGSEIAPLIPHGDGSTEPTDLDVGKRRLRVRTGRRGNEIVVRVEKGAARTRAATKQPPRVVKDFELPVEIDVPELPSDALTLDESAPKPQTAAPEQYGGMELDLGDAALEIVKPAGPQFARGQTSSGAKLATSSALAPAISQETARAFASGQTGALPKLGTLQPATPLHKPGTFAAFVAQARAAKATDLHIAGNRVVSIRVNNDLVPIEEGAQPLAAEQAEQVLLPLLNDEERARLQTAGYVDLAVDAPGGGRLRANISRHQVGLKGTFRLAFDRPMTLEELGLPKDIAKVVSHHQGFVVIAGPSGHGKTTTLASLVDVVNSSKPHHILTVEDPIEIEHPRKVALVSQREAGRHTKSFATALKASLREDPDVIVIGELRDRETVEIALTAAETGHLVLATMSTPNAAKTLDRLIDMFPPEEHSQVRASIAGALRAIVAQRLIPAVGGGVVPAIELVTGVLPLAVLIRD